MATEEERARAYRQSVRNRWQFARAAIHVFTGDHAARIQLQQQWDPLRLAFLEKRDKLDPSSDLPSYLWGEEE